jgi:hypothetical protein
LIYFFKQLSILISIFIGNDGVGGVVALCEKKKLTLSRQDTTTQRKQKD